MAAKKHFVALYVGTNYWIVAKGYRLYRYEPETDRLVYFSRINDTRNGVLARFALTRRLFRAEITHLYHFQKDNWMCIARKGIFKFDKSSGVFKKCCGVSKGSRPMNLCQASDGTLYFGDYYYNPKRGTVNIYQSKNDGETWTIAYSFADNEVNHIHSIMQDPYTNLLWVTTGDDDVACIIGYTCDGFKTFNRAYCGSQQWRTHTLFFTKEKIIFATDSQLEQNYIRCIDRKTGNVQNLQAIQGSGIYAVRNGKLMMVSTTVEPSALNHDKKSHLWYSWNGHSWKELISFEKDILKKTYFQFGSIRFPYYESESEYAVFHGRALKELDGKTMIILKERLSK